MTDETKLQLTSSDVTAEILSQLREIAPQVFTEAGVDFDKLKATLGDIVVPKDERYGLSWAGKSEAFRNVQTPSVGTLLPQPEESVNFDTTENLIIEGDNLEVLKLLQKSYHGKVKMIYIDPPYNTGNEFIYPDNFHEGLGDYLKYSGQVNDEGQAQSSNTETSGRFHSKWLNMMYPRLFLARNLLRDDGVIFVSIDDNEVHNLRMLMSEVFGEENFCGMFVWEKKKKPSFLNANMGVTTEYILSFSKDRQKSPAFTNGTVEDGKMYPFNNAGNPLATLTFPAGSVTFNLPDGAVQPQDMSEGNIVTRLLDTLVIKNGTNQNDFRLSGEWRYSQKKLDEFIANGDEIVIRKIPFRPNYVNRSDKEKKTANLLTGKGTGTPTYEDATEELRVLFGEDVIEYPKPSGLVSFLIKAVTSANDIVLDFFAGSGTTAHAVMKTNVDDTGQRKFILVQLPEKTENPEYPTIADITRERVRRVIKKLKSDYPSSDQDGGFRAFKLTTSSFKIWNADTTSTDATAIGEQLRLYADNVERERTQQDILYELILKSGLPLSAEVEQIEVVGKPVFSIAKGQLLICLENEVSPELLRGMIALTPIQMVCLDRAFGGNDQLKTNTVLEAKSQDVTFRTV